MSINEYDQLCEYLGMTPVTNMEEYLVRKIWECASDEFKDEVRDIEL